MTVEAAAVPPAVDAMSDSPWLGLQSYEERHRSLFFGREADTDALFRLVKRDVLTVLYGMSGLGKTSLLNAGLFPLLRRHWYLPIPVRLGIGGKGVPDPVVLVGQAIASEVAARCIDTPAPAAAETLWEYFHRTTFLDRADPTRALTPVLVFDQFEEVIRRGAADPGRRALYEELSDLIENAIPTSVRARVEGSGDGLPFRYDNPKSKVLFSLREDYLGELQELKPLIPSLMRNVHHLKPMNGRQAADAVIKPAGKISLAIGDDVAERIVRISAGETERGTRAVGPAEPLERLEVEPALLSLFCDELNKARIERGLTTITMELARGERGGILLGFYESRTKDLAPAVKQFIEEQLLTREGHRKAAVEEDLDDDIQAEVKKLIDRRLLRRETPPGRPSYLELMHDVLAEPIVKSRNDRRQEDAIERWQEQARLKQVARRAKVIRIAAGICTVLLVISSWLIATWAQRRAELAEQAAKHQQQRWYAEEVLGTAAEALATRPDGWITSALLATEAIRMQATPKTISTWAEAIDRSPQRELPIRDPLAAIALSPDGKTLAAAGDDGILRLWDLEQGRQRTQLEDRRCQGSISTISFTAGGQRLLTVAGVVQYGSHEQPVRLQVWDPELGTCLLERRSTLTPVAFSADGTYAAGLDSRKRVRVWNIERDRSSVTLPSRPALGTITERMALSRGGKRLATVSSDGVARVWDVDSGRQLAQLEEPLVAVTALAFSPDGKRLATAVQGAAFRVQIWDAELGVRLTERKLPSPASTIAFSADGNRIATGHRTGERTVKLWALHRPAEMSRLMFETRPQSMALSPDGRRLVAALGQRVRLWDLESGQEVPIRELFPEGLTTAVAISADGSCIATVSGGRTAVIVWPVWSEAALARLDHQAEVTGVAVDSGGTRLATAAADNTVRVWDLLNGHETMQLPHPNTVSAVAISADGTRLATGSSDGRARLWDLKNSGLVSEWVHALPVKIVALSRDGKRLATVTTDDTARVWEEASERESVRLPHVKPVRSMAFAAAGGDLVTIDVDHIVRAWPLTVDRMIGVACASLPRNLSSRERADYFGDAHYPATCANLPED